MLYGYSYLLLFIAEVVLEHFNLNYKNLKFILINYSYHVIFKLVYFYLFFVIVFLKKSQMLEIKKLFELFLKSFVVIDAKIYLLNL